MPMMNTKRAAVGGKLAAMTLVIAGVAALALAQPAQAYVGPGAGLTAIGTVLALLAALGLAIVGFVWYPIRRLRRRLKADAGAQGAPGADNRR